MMPASSSIPIWPLRRRWIAVYGLVAVMLILSTASAVDPLLYAAKNRSTTGFHQDLAATGDTTRIDAALVLEEWATSLNLTGQLVHDIKLRDLQAAEDDLQKYLESGGNLKDYVIQLDMNDTDVATFQEDNLANAWALRGLLGQIREYDELQEEATTAREQRNVSGLKAVELRGEDLRVSIRSNYDEYAYRSGGIIGASQKFGLDTSAFEQSVREFAAIVTEIDVEQKARSSSIQEAIRGIQSSGQGSGAGGGSSREISLKIVPDHGVYGDTLSMAGTVDAPPGTGVTIVVDGRQIGTTLTGQDGRFSFPYRIGQVVARAHTAYASIGSDLSDVTAFTVGTRNTTLSLTARFAEENGTRKCIGTGRLVTEDGVPVQGAQVHMDLDSPAIWSYGVTGDDGEYSSSAELTSSQIHTLKARFSPGGFPLNGSESASLRVEVPASFGWMAALVYLLGVGGAAVGGILFLWKRHPTDVPPSADTDEAAPSPRARRASVPTIVEAGLMADQVIVTNEERVDGCETIARTYRRLVQELERKNPGLRLRSRTPRDLAALFADRPYGDQLALLVGIHEKVRYAEYEPGEDDLRQVREAFIHIVTGEEE